MTPTERHPLLASYATAHDQLTAALARFPAAMWRYRPADGSWSIHQIVVHITDSEANSYVRCRRCLAEPGQTVMAYDEMGWAAALHYEEQSTDDALALFRGLRHNTCQLIRALPDGVCANTVYHPENGVMTLDDWLGVYAAHVPDHIAQMQRVYDEWAAQQGA